jgi:hypothetical protein
MRLEDEEGYPWTARPAVEWLLLAALFLTSCLIVFPLGIYLSLWIHRKGRSNLPLQLFTLSTAFLPIALALGHWLPQSIITSGAVLTCWLLLCTASLLLQHEIQAHFQATEGWQPAMNSGLTIIGSAFYINHRLVPDRLSVPDTLQSLNLPNPRNLRK